MPIFLLRRLRLVTSLLLSLLVVLALGVQTTAGPYRIDVVTDPATIPVGKANLVITVTDASGKPVTGAQVRAIARMPGMNMGEREESARPGDAPGQYVAPAAFPMGGLYEVVVTVSGAQGQGKGTVEMKTGQTTARAGGGGRFSLLSVLPWVVGAAGLAFVLYRVRKTGQRLNVRAVLNRQVLGSLLLLGVALAVAMWFVNNKRRPGAMTPIEAQAMEMNTPAPEGTLPVVLARVERRPLVATVPYTGQAVGYVEQDVVPRVTGTIVWMPYYVGDRVKNGQLLARLDTSQLDPEVAMRSATVGRAQQGVGVAALEYQEALNEVAQARAEVGMAQGELSEARAMLRATEQGRGTASAELASAEAEVQSARAEVTAAEAERTYMRAEYARMQELFKARAVSRDEFQRSKADADKADATVRQAREGVRKAQSAVRAARAMQRRVEAEIVAARRKVQQAEAGVRARQAAVRTAQAGASAAKGRVGQERSMVREATAGLKGAATQRGYAELRATVDGVITARLISPGVTVSPGQAVLRVSQISPIRLQANVAESDLPRIRVGSLARVTHRGGKEQGVTARIASVSPALDPGARTGVVEAIFENRERRFLPGQFVSMVIPVGEGGPSLVIPASAVQRSVEPSPQGVNSTNTQTYVWTAEPGAGGEFTVARREVELGERSGELVAVRTGLKEGQRVVVSPSPSLREEMRVTDASSPGGIVATEADETSNAPMVKITERGYEPDTVEVPSGRPARITFLRTTDQTCGTEIVFPELRLQKPLPLNKPVTVELPAGPRRELRFTCGMDMFRGKVVVR